ncbi:MAG: hypothetical protein P8Y62_06290 [candidate division WOR-3 bacterium]
MKVYEKLYEINKSEKIKEKIEQIKKSDKEDILDFESEEVGEGESLFSELDKKAPIEMEEHKEDEGEKEEKKAEDDDEEVDGSFREWIDGLGGA